MGNKSVLDQFEIRKLPGHSRPDYSGVSVKVESVKVEPECPGIIDRYRLEARLFTVFDCNQAQYRDAKENAEKRILRALYSDIEIMVRAALDANYSRDHREVHGILCGLLDHISGQ